MLHCLSRVLEQQCERSQGETDESQGQRGGETETQMKIAVYRDKIKKERVKMEHAGSTDGHVII